MYKTWYSTRALIMEYLALMGKSRLADIKEFLEFNEIAKNRAGIAQMLNQMVQDGALAYDGYYYEIRDLGKLWEYLSKSGLVELARAESKLDLDTRYRVSKYMALCYKVFKSSPGWYCRYLFTPELLGIVQIDLARARWFVCAKIPYSEFRVPRSVLRRKLRALWKKIRLDPQTNPIASLKPKKGARWLELIGLIYDWCSGLSSSSCIQDCVLRIRYGVDLKS